MLSSMPRQARLDAPETLHHVMVRGIERRALFRDDTDRADFVARLAPLAESGALTVYAWALLPNHAHFLVRTGTRPLARSMRSLLTGYAGAFNRRHHRVGHLFQNRYKSLVVEEEPYLLELVRYLHLNPVRATVLSDLRTLDRYPWTGHSALLGTVPRPWQATATILAQYGPSRRRARHAYRTFVAEGIPQGRRPELQGGGLVRSAGGWAAVTALRRGREAYGGDERVLGGDGVRGGAPPGSAGLDRGIPTVPPTGPGPPRRGGRRRVSAGGTRRAQSHRPARPGPGRGGVPVVPGGGPGGARAGGSARPLAPSGLPGGNPWGTGGGPLEGGVE